MSLLYQYWLLCMTLWLDHTRPLLYPYVLPYQSLTVYYRSLLSTAGTVLPFTSEGMLCSSLIWGYRQKNLICLHRFFFLNTWVRSYPMWSQQGYPTGQIAENVLKGDEVLKTKVFYLWLECFEHLHAVVYSHGYFKSAIRFDLLLADQKFGQES